MEELFLPSTECKWSFDDTTEMYIDEPLVPEHVDGKILLGWMLGKKSERFVLDSSGSE